MKVLKEILELIMFVFGSDGDIRREAEKEGISDYSGQGRSRNGG